MDNWSTVLDNYKLNPKKFDEQFYQILIGFFVSEWALKLLSKGIALIRDREKKLFVLIA